MPTSKIERRASLAKILAQWVILAGILNVVIRIPLTPEADLSAYYASSPIIAAILFLSSSGFRRRIIFLAAALSWGWFAGYLFGTATQSMIVQTAFVFLSFMSIESVINWRNKSPDFYKNSEKIYDFATLFVVIVFVVQTIFDFDVPGTSGYRDRGLSSSIYFTPNDLALYISTYLVLIIFSNKRILVKIVIFLVVFFINLYNDANLALAANFVTALMALLIGSVRKIPYPFLLISAPIAIAIPLAVGFILGSSASGGGVDEVTGALWKILTLERFYLGGSLYDRTDALIIGMTEFAHSNFLGLGPGGSTAVLAKEENILATAKSMHNGLAELSFDLGPSFIIPLIIVVSISIYRLMFTRRPSSEEYSLFTLILCFPLLSMVQSGFLANYGFLTCATTIWLRARRQKITTPNPLPA